MIQDHYIIIQNDKIANNIYKMVVEGDTKAVISPGQFVNIRIEGCFLRRPISICDWNDKTITLLYKVVGKGTEILSEMKPLTKLDMLVGLGNGFSIKDSKVPMLIGGGIGLAPLFGLCRRMPQKTVVVIGADTQRSLFFVDEFKSLGADVIISTDDGSEGTKGFVTDAIKTNNIECDYFYTCGPMPMMNALNTYLPETVPGQFSLESRMGCGFGACVGCSIETTNGVKRICKDGPVFYRNDLRNECHKM